MDGGQSTLDDVPHDLVLDRIYVHGWPDASLKRGIALNSAAVSRGRRERRGGAEPGRHDLPRRGLCPAYALPSTD